MGNLNSLARPYGLREEADGLSPGDCVPGGWLVSAWTLSTACLFLPTSALVETLDHFDVDIPCSPSWWSFLRCVELTDAGAAKVAAAGKAMRIGMLWCAAPQAAAAALALLLPRRYRRVRRALAYLALAIAVVGHNMYACACLLVLAAGVGGLFYGLCCTLGIFLYTAGDNMSFLALVGGEQ